MSSRVMDVTTDPTIREQEFGMLQKPEVRRYHGKGLRTPKDAARTIFTIPISNGLFII